MMTYAQLLRTLGRIEQRANAAYDRAEEYPDQFIFLLKLGEIVSFDTASQSGVILSEGNIFQNIRTLSPFKFELLPKDQVVLIQAREDIFSAPDGIVFSKGSFYILQPVEVNKIKLKAEMELKLESPVLKINGQVLEIECDSISLKGKAIDINSTAPISIGNDAVKLKALFQTVSNALNTIATFVAPPSGGPIPQAAALPALANTLEGQANAILK